MVLHLSKVSPEDPHSNTDVWNVCVLGSTLRVYVVYWALWPIECYVHRPTSRYRSCGATPPRLGATRRSVESHVGRCTCMDGYACERAARERVRA